MVVDARNSTKPQAESGSTTGVKLNTRRGFCFRAVTALLLCEVARASLVETASASLDGFIVRYGDESRGKVEKFWPFRLHRCMVSVFLRGSSRCYG